MKYYILLFALLFQLVMNAQTKEERKWAWMHYEDHNFTESFKEYSHLSQFQDPDDLFNLAQHYLYGEGTERDRNKALYYFKMAADRGHSSAQLEVCDLLDDEEPFESEQQKKDLYKYCRMYCTNFEYTDYTSSATEKAWYSLYKCYKNGWGTQKDLLLADIWLSFGAFYDSMDSQDEFCSLYGIDGNYDSDLEELALSFTYFRHLYETIQPYIQDDNSIESQFFNIYYLIAQQTTSSTVEGFNKLLSLYEDPRLSNEGAACLYDLIAEYIKYSSDLKEKYGNDLEKYELVSDKDKATWQHTQLTKVIWKVDVILNKSNQRKGRSNGHEWVDLGLPSGTKWATCNIGAKIPNESGALYAWGDIKKKKNFSSNNYSGDRSLLIMDNSNDMARILVGDNWNMPTCEDWRELFRYCDMKYDANQNAIVVSSPNDQHITIPLVQSSEKDGITYWTNTCVLAVRDPITDSAISLILESKPDWGFYFEDKWCGCPIRPVYRDNN